jgi:hypothetical protein
MVQVKEIHDGIHFKDMSRGWHPKNVKYDKGQWKKRKLQVVLMPHTHVDPGKELLAPTYPTPFALIATFLL